MSLAILLVAVLILLAVVAHAYLAGKERRGWAAMLDKERGAHDAEKRDLVAKVQRLTAENQSHAARSASDESARAVLEARVMQLEERALSAERALAARAR